MELNERTIIEIAYRNLLIGKELIHNVLVDAQRNNRELEIGKYNCELLEQLRHVESAMEQIRQLFDF